MMKSNWLAEFLKKISCRKLGVAFAFLGLSIAGLLLLWRCINDTPENSLNQIFEQKKLSVSLISNSTDYFIYRGYPMGFQLELLEHYAQHLGVKLNIKTSNSLSTHFEWLKNGETQICAANVAITHQRKKSFLFSTPLYYTNQVIVQCASSDLTQKSYLKNIEDFNGKTIYVPNNSIYLECLQELREMSNQDFEIIELDDVNEESLAHKVSSGEIQYALIAKNIANIVAKDHTDLDYNLTIGKQQKIAWMINKSQDTLLLSINHWLAEFEKTTTFQRLYNKYFLQNRNIKLPPNDSVNKTRISSYDAIIKKQALQIGWDWKLLASLIFQESQFKVDLESWAGAFGLMQLMPQTAEKFKVTKTSSPEEQITGGIKYIKWLDKQLPQEILDSTERINFILAAYNSGLGHVLDARRLACKFGKNPNLWFDQVEDFFLLKSDPEFYQDSVVYYGYARGYETYNFVREIIARFHHYSNLIQ